MNNKIRNLKFVIIIALFTIVFGILGTTWLSRKVVNIYFDEVNAEYEYVIGIAKERKDLGEFITEYDIKAYENTAKNIAFLLREGMDNNTITKDELIELNKDIKMDNLIVIDKNGDVVASSYDKAFDFKNEKYDELRNIVYDNKKNALFKIKNNEVEDYYFSAKINDELILIVYCDGQNVIFDNNYSYSWESELFDKKIDNAINFYVLKQGTDEITYNYDKSYIGKNIDFDIVSIDYDDYKFAKVFDDWGFVKKLPLGDVDIVFFIYLYNVMRKPIVYILFTLLAFLICLVFMAVYSVVVSEEANLIKEGFSDTVDITKYENNRKRKIRTISLMAIVIMTIVMLIFGGVYSVAIADEETTYFCETTKDIVENATNNAKTLNKFEDSYYLVNNKFINLVLQKHSDKINRKDLSRIANSLGIEELRILNLDGETICTSNGLDKYKLSKDKEDQSYKCWNLLSEDGYLKLPVSKDIDGNEYQYFCSTLRDIDLNVSGIVMSKYNINEIQEVKKQLNWYEIVKNTMVENKLHYYTIDTKEEIIIDASNKEIIGCKINSGALPIKATVDGFQGIIYDKENELFGKTIQAEDKIIGAFLGLERITNSAIIDVCVLILFVAILLILYMMLISDLSKDYSVERVTLDVDNSHNFVINRMFVSNWSRITGTQKISLLVSYLFIILMFVFSIVLLYGGKIFGENSIINYIINGDWDRSLNILAFSKCILIMSFILLIALIAKKLLEYLSRSFDSRGVTICRLLENFVHYAAIFVSLYQCLGLVGVDTKTLIASAGILSLVVGLGANKLIQEVVAGLFLIFEGSFQVGDTITTKSGFTGVVKEIGIRNTKIVSVDGNVMILSNSEFSQVINKSTAKTLIVYEYNILKNISLDVCDTYFNGKIDYLKEKFGELVKEIRYEGIIAYSADSYTIRFSISCMEENKVKLEFKIDNEMKLLIEELKGTTNN